MKKWCFLPWLLLSVLFSAMPPVKPGACPTCNPGFGLEGCRCVECKATHYWSKRNKETRCNACTAPCEDSKNMIEITACMKTGDRSCQCKPGYYCPSPVPQTCRRACEPCVRGFTNTSNLQRSCQEFTNCASLGMVVIKKGSPTSDYVCGKPTTPNSTATSLDTTAQRFSPSTQQPYSLKSVNKSVFTTAQRFSPSTQQPYSLKSVNKSVFTTAQRFSPSTQQPSSLKSVNKSVFMVLWFSSQNPVTVSSLEMTAPSSVSAEVARIPEGNEGSVPPSESYSKPTWIILLLLLISFLFVVTCLFFKCKSRTIKNKLEWAGLAYGRYQPVIPTASLNPKVETSVPVSDGTDTIREVQGQGSFPRKNQQVTMEHVGKADGINNTVGSIFIYSPGMVILGSNTNEKREEAETSGEDSSEDTCLMSVPQQESSSEEDFIRFATQEELGKELSIPIPATSK